MLNKKILLKNKFKFEIIFFIGFIKVIMEEEKKMFITKQFPFRYYWCVPFKQ